MKITELRKIEAKIEHLRKCLYSSIDQNDTLLVKQVIRISQELDEVLNDYDKLRSQLNVGFGI